MDIVGKELLISWDRQSEILMNVVGILQPDLLDAKPSDDGWTIVQHLHHLQGCRRFWLMQVSPIHAEGLGNLTVVINDVRTVQTNLVDIKRELLASSLAVRTAIQEALEAKLTVFGPYSHPVQFIQHMLWHEGYHFALIMLALRQAGHEPSEEWEGAHVWNIWRDPASV